MNIPNAVLLSPGTHVAAIKDIILDKYTERENRFDRYLLKFPRYNQRTQEIGTWTIDQ